MKKVLLLITIMTVISSNVFSQTEKRNLMLGGNMNLNINLTAKGTVLNINPAFGLFVKDNFLIGINPNFSIPDKNFIMGLGIHSRLYFLKKENSSFFALASGGCADLTSEVGPSRRSNYVSFGFGHTWFMRKNIGFEINLLGNYFDFDKNFRLISNFGFQIYLDRKPKVQSK